VGPIHVVLEEVWVEEMAEYVPLISPEFFCIAPYLQVYMKLLLEGGQTVLVDHWDLSDQNWMAR